MAKALSFSKRNIMIAAALVVAAVAYTFMAGGSDTTAEMGYRTKTADSGNIFRSVAASGAVNAVTEVEIGSQLSGQIKELYADFNDEVEADEIIALIDPEMFEMRLGQRRAELAVSEADLLSRRAQLESDRSAADLLEREVERQQPLFDRGNISASAIDNTKTSAKQARQRVAMSEAAVVNAEAVVLQRKSSVTQAEIELNRTKIRAPIDGVIVERAVDVGQTVAASMQAPILFRLANDLRDVRVEASVDEADIGQVKAGQDVTFTVDAYPDRNFAGKVEEVRLAPVIEQNVVTYTVTILASNNDLALLPGMTANVEITTGKRDDVIRISNDALRFKPRNGEDESEQQGGGGFDPQAMIGRMVDPIARAAELTDDQTDALKEELGPVIQGAMANAQNGGGFSGMRQTIDKAITKYIEENGSSEQLEAYEAYKKAAAERMSQRRGNAGRRATVWVIGEDGKAERKNVMLGLSDAEYTEVRRGLEAGDEVITGYARRRVE